MLQINSNSLRAVFSPLGARLMALYVDGVDMIIGNPFEFSPDTGDHYAGAVVGRYAGRITRARYELDGQTHVLTPNRDDFQLHGGPQGFATLPWQGAVKGQEALFHLVSPDGDQGFPGEVDVTAAYQVKANVLSLDVEATTTRPTAINLTNHAYWNLAGPQAAEDSALAHEMQINATRYAVFTPQLLATGELAPVAGTRYDFRKLRPVAEGYDNCFALDGRRGQLRQAVTVRDPRSGRRMEMWTTECAVQFYNGVYWDGTVPSKTGMLQRHQGIAIEAQNFPDAPNHRHFPSAILRPGQRYHQRIEWRFS